MSEMRERVAREIDPIAFKSHAAMLEYCVNHGDEAETAKMYADKSYGPSIEKAFALADAVIPIILAEAAKVAREHSRQGGPSERVFRWEHGENIATAIQRLAERG